MRQNHAMHPHGIVGTVTRVGYYRDTLPQLIITAKKEDSRLLNYRIGEKVFMPMVVNGEHYQASIRTTEQEATVRICSVLNDAAGNPVRLADVLFGHGWTNSKVNLVVKDGTVYCHLNGK